MRVGTVTIPEGRTHQEHYEVAAWYTNVALTPGTYEVHASGETTSSPYQRLHAKVPGTIVEKYMPALWGGMPVGKEPQGKAHRDVGNATEVYLHVGADEVTFDADCGLAWRWIEGFGSNPQSYGDKSYPGMTVRAHKSLVRVTNPLRAEFRIDPNDGSLPEFTESHHIVVERVTELLAQGHDPDVWRVVYTDDGRPWFETPVEEHRGLYAMKYRRQPDHGWRYYLPDYNPRARARI